jgi:hypothetical protein
MSTFSHPASSDALNAYVDGTLTSAERAAVEATVATSPELRQELLELQATATLLGSLPELQPRRSFRLGEEYARPTAPAQPANVSPIVRLLPIVRSLSVAAALIFMVVAGAFFFDVNGNPGSDTEQTLQQQNVIMGVTDSSSDASEHAEDASESDSPESSMVERGDAASASDEPTDDLTALAPSAEQSADGSTAQDSGPFGATASDDQDYTPWIIASVAFGGLVVVFGGAWYVLAQNNRTPGSR